MINNAQEFDQLIRKHSVCGGVLARKGPSVQASMMWRLADNTDGEFSQSFLRMRCEEMFDIFSGFPGSHGIDIVMKDVQENKTVFIESCCHRCVRVGYYWKQMPPHNWEELKKKFLAMFEIAFVHATGQDGQRVSDIGDELLVTSEFVLAEKGTS